MGSVVPLPNRRLGRTKYRIRSKEMRVASEFAPIFHEYYGYNEEPAPSLTSEIIDEALENPRIKQKLKSAMKKHGAQLLPSAGAVNAAIITHHNKLTPLHLSQMLRHFQSAQFEEISPEFLEALRKRLGLKELKNPFL